MGLEIVIPGLFFLKETSDHGLLVQVSLGGVDLWPLGHLFHFHGDGGASDNVRDNAA